MPTLFIARTGELTPPGMNRRASSKRRAEVTVCNRSSLSERRTREAEDYTTRSARPCAFVHNLPRNARNGAVSGGLLAAGADRDLGALLLLEQLDRRREKLPADAFAAPVLGDDEAVDEARVGGVEQPGYDGIAEQPHGRAGIDRQERVADRRGQEVAHVVLIDGAGVVDGDGEFLDELHDGGLVARAGVADGHCHGITLLLADGGRSLPESFAGGLRVPVPVPRGASLQASAARRRRGGRPIRLHSARFWVSCARMHMAVQTA